jgi:hypothetical protein
VYAPSSVAVDHESHALNLAPAISFSLWNLMWALGVALGAIVGPFIAQFTGNPVVYVMLGIVAALLGILGLRGRPRSGT